MSGATAVRSGPRHFANEGPASRQHLGVEVAGIEPASFDASPGLLRAQFALPLLGPTVHANESVWRAQSLFGVPRVPATGTRSESSS